MYLENISVNMIIHNNDQIDDNSCQYRSAEYLSELVIPTNRKKSTNSAIDNVKSYRKTICLYTFGCSVQRNVSLCHQQIHSIWRKGNFLLYQYILTYTFILYSKYSGIYYSTVILYNLSLKKQF